MEFYGRVVVVLVVVVVLAASLAGSNANANRRGRRSGLSQVLSPQLFDRIFLHKDNPACPANNFYTYRSLIAAANRFPAFASSGCPATRRREVAAFLAQISHETTGGWPTAPDGPYSWGLCFKEEVSPQSIYCDASNTEWPCSPGKSYKGRGPIQLSWNYNYGPAGRALGFDGLNNPDLVSNSSLLAFQTALWFWMTPQPPKPSCHRVIIGRYVPTAADVASNRTVGYGLLTNIINGGLECDRPGNSGVADRIGYFQRYAALLNVSTGPNLDCAYQRSF